MTGHMYYIGDYRILYVGYFIVYKMTSIFVMNSARPCIRTLFSVLSLIQSIIEYPSISF